MAKDFNFKITNRIPEGFESEDYCFGQLIAYKKDKFQLLEIE